MDEKNFLEIIQVGKEGRNLEFKRSMPWETAEFKARITKSVLAFSNVRDGGHIIIGVEQQEGGIFSFNGMEEAHISTYIEDEVVSVISEYADPYVRLQIDKVVSKDNKYIVITVFEFDEMPVLCKRDGLCKLRKGAIYTRTHRMAESAEVPSQTELREILDMATEKNIRKYWETQARVGLVIQQQPRIDDAEKFKSQRSDLL